MAAQFEVYKDKRGYFRWRLKADGVVIASSDCYYSKAGADKAIDLLKANAPIATVVPLDKPPNDLTPEERQRQEILEKQNRLNVLGEKIMRPINSKLRAKKPLDGQGDAPPPGR